MFSLGIIGGAIYLAHEWQQRSWVWDPALERWLFAPNFGANEETMLLVIAIVLMHSDRAYPRLGLKLS